MNQVAGDKYVVVLHGWLGCNWQTLSRYGRMVRDESRDLGWCKRDLYSPWESKPVWYRTIDAHDWEVEEDALLLKQDCGKGLHDGRYTGGGTILNAFEGQTGLGKR